MPTKLNECTRIKSDKGYNDSYLKLRTPNLFFKFTKTYNIILALLSLIHSKSTIEKQLLGIIIGFQLFRLLLIPFTGLMPQDAYYYYYGQQLDWSYFDHPGMIGYLLRLSTEVFGPHVWVIKLTDFIVSSLSLWAFYKLAQCFLSSYRSLIATFILAVSVMWSMLSFNSTPDVPLILFWTLSLLYYYKAIRDDKWSLWLLAGLFSGLAFNSKYTALLIPFGLIAFIVFSKQHRSKLLSPKLWLSLLLCIVLFFPVIYWNIQHDFISFGFQTSDRSTAMGLSSHSPRLFLGFLGSQMLLIYPVVFLSLTVLIYKFTKRFLKRFKLPSTPVLFLLSFCIPTFLGFFLLSPLYWIKINWLLPSYMSGIILVAMVYKSKWIKTHFLLSVVLLLSIAVELLFKPFPIKSDDTFIGWEPFAEQVDELLETYPEDFVFSLDNYKTTAVLQFYIPQKTFYNKNIVGLQSLQYSITQETSSLKGKNALLIDSETQFKNDEATSIIPKELSNFFERVEITQPILVKDQNGVTIRKFNVFRCYNYLGINSYR